jgi:hypothetical protein
MTDRLIEFFDHDGVYERRWPVAIDEIGALDDMLELVEPDAEGRLLRRSYTARAGHPAAALGDAGRAVIGSRCSRGSPDPGEQAGTHGAVDEADGVVVAAQQVVRDVADRRLSVLPGVLSEWSLSGRERRLEAGDALS